MKKRFYLAAFAAMALASCNERNVYIPEKSVKDEMVELEVNVPLSQTRIAGTASDADEKKVNTLQVFVFNESGALEAYGNEKASSLKLTCLPGSKKLLALVNAPSLSDIAGLDDLQEKRSLLSDNSADGLVMISDVIEEELTAENESVTIEVARLAAKVVLGDVTNQMSLEVNQNKTFTVTKVYLTNVAGDRLYLQDSDPLKWYNQMKYESDNTLPFLCDVCAETIAYEDTYSGSHYFYCYPNHIETDANAGSWTPRKTRLVVEAALGNQTCYYPLTLPQIDCNTEYVINLTVTRPGSPDPDIPVSTEDATFTVTVKDWTDGGERNEII